MGKDQTKYSRDAQEARKMREIERGRERERNGGAKIQASRDRKIERKREREGLCKERRLRPQFRKTHLRSTNGGHV